jgi:hypothetical protein
MLIVPREIENQPCRSHEIHLKQLRVLGRTMKNFGPKSGADRNCRNVINWLAHNPGDIYCTCLLLSLLDLLQKAPAGFAVAYEEYDKAHARLLGMTISGLFAKNEAVRKLSDVGQPRGTSAARLWEEINESFTKTSSWREKNRVLTRVLEVVGSIRDFGAHGGFWDMYDLFTTCLTAAYQNVVQPDDHLKASSRSYFQLFYSIAERLGSQSVDAVESARKPAYAEVLARAAQLALQIAVRADDDVLNWANAVVSLREVIGGQLPTVENILSDTALDLAGFAASSSATKRRSDFGEALSFALPALRNRDPAGPRVRLPPDECTCSLGLVSDETVEGKILNVCRTRFRGFAVRTEELTFAGPVSGDGGSPIEEYVDSFQVRSVEVRRWRREGAQPTTISHVPLRFEFGGIQATFRCRILRAWPLRPPNDGIGMALLAPSDDLLPNGWQQYVGGLTTSGRYDPDNPSEGTQ